MNKTRQAERLDYLVEEFKADSAEYKNIDTPADRAGKKALLRSLMNIRMPGALPEHVTAVQDQYLTEAAQERGIVQLDDIPVAEWAGEADDPEVESRSSYDIASAQACANSTTGATSPATGISIWQGDITRLAVDAIVNAANSQMLGCFRPMHSCIDNCIHTFAGVQLRAECDRQMQALRAEFGADYEQPTAVPMLTDAYNLPARKVIHIVGPIVYSSLTESLEQDLADCYRNTLDMCLANGLRSVAFCCISTGVFHFPNQRAAEIAVDTVKEWIEAHPAAMDRVIFNVFKDEDKEYYNELLG